MITITNLEYKYTNFKLENINLCVKSGEILAITGKNGSGKTTLLQLIGGVLKPKHGQILIDDIPLKKNKKIIGLVQQNPDNQIIFNNVYDDIAFTLKNYGINKEEYDERIEEALKKVGMESFKNAETFNLSTGQKQRIVIANMLAIKPEIIIFDEATAYLDQSTKMIIYKLFEELKNDGVSVIFSTNELSEIVYADKVLIMDNGKIKSINNIEEVVKDLSVFEERFIPLKLQLLSLLKLNCKSDEEIIQKIKERLKW